MLEAAGAPVSESAWKIEPSPGQYDTAYLDATQERLNWFAEPPEWAIEDDDLPFEQHPVWSFNYFAPAVMAALTTSSTTRGNMLTCRTILPTHGSRW
ncbi:MAG: hypothetical protein AMJ63_04125 [Myxococcales bacterium SG8_38_1]|nr:MAG: hypothetical protein AMJ63_04125 [Myxococcales bacterium SG8_38_1]